MGYQNKAHEYRINHVIQRARERYRLGLDRKDVEYIEFRMFYMSDPLIKSLGRSGGTSLYAVRVKGYWLAFIFDMVNRRALTVYPVVWLTCYRKELDQLKKRFKKEYADVSDHPLWNEIKKQKLLTNGYSESGQVL